ncbi:MAG: tetratricopeptide repeat protein [Myxococcota bacterium]
MLIGSLKRYILAGTIPLLALSFAPPATGQSAEVKAGARAAANQGLEAFKAGDYEQAIDRFERANQLIRAPTHTLFLARAHEKLGHLVLARELYLELDRETLPNDAPPAFVQAQQDARAELEALEPRVPRITVDVTGGGDETVEVTVNDKPMPVALVGLERPIDPGEHRFRASSDGSKARPVTVSIEEGERKTVTLELRTLATTEPLFDDPPPPPAEQPTEDAGVSGTTVAGITALGVGAIGLGLGAYFIKQESDFESDADTLFKACNPRVCTQSERQRIAAMDEDAATSRNMSTASFIVGGVGVASGIVLLMLAPSGEDDAGLSESGEHAGPSPRVQPWVGLGSAGVMGQF